EYSTLPNSIVLKRAGISSMYTILKQRCLHWFGHVVRMDDGRIPKDLLYDELVQRNCPRGRPQLRYKDICKRDLKVLGMNLNRWETLTSNRTVLRQKIMVYINLKRHLSNRQRKRGRHGNNETRGLGKKENTSVPSV
ncbi:hypothetical protein JRQ81_001089, partial [Phrynocephalus forsythii]